MKNIQHSTFNIQHSTGMRSGHRWVLNVECWVLNVPQSVLIFAIRAYQLTISPAQLFLFGSAGGCRFTPTCSQYAVESIRTHGSITGGYLAVKRICRCHPWGGCGHDPVPEFGIRNSEFGISPKHTH